jgi:hypothetical protein
VQGNNLYGNDMIESPRHCSSVRGSGDHDDNDDNDDAGEDDGHKAHDHREKESNDCVSTPH